jgi:ATP-dependent DNA ligase
VSRIDRARTCSHVDRLGLTVGQQRVVVVARILGNRAKRVSCRQITICNSMQTVVTGLLSQRAAGESDPSESMAERPLSRPLMLADGTIGRVTMRFIPPMLCTTLRDPRRVGDPRYVAEPKFDGQRARSTSTRSCE